MGHMVVKFKIMVHDRMVDMIQLEKVFQGSRLFLMLGLDVMHLDGVDINS